MGHARRRMSPLDFGLPFAIVRGRRLSLANISGEFDIKLLKFCALFSGLWCKHWKSSQAGVLGLDVDHAASTAFQISGAVLFLMGNLPSLN